MNSAKKSLATLLGLALVIVVVGGGVWVYQQQQITELEKEIITLKSELDTAKQQQASPVVDELVASQRDIERETDLKALQGQIEAYYAMNGYYPTLEDMNSSAFRAANMKGLDDEALRDPSGQTARLAREPAKGTYSYAPKPDGCSEDCISYTLTATYENGTTYTRNSLNN